MLTGGANHRGSYEPDKEQLLNPDDMLAAPAGDIRSLRSRTQHLSPLATSLFRVSIWASDDKVISELLTVYFYALGLDAAAQNELPEDTHMYLTKMVTRYPWLLCNTKYCMQSSTAKHLTVTENPVFYAPEMATGKSMMQSTWPFSTAMAGYAVLPAGERLPGQARTAGLQDRNRKGCQDGLLRVEVVCRHV